MACSKTGNPGREKKEEKREEERERERKKGREGKGRGKEREREEKGPTVGAGARSVFYGSDGHRYGTTG